MRTRGLSVMRTLSRQGRRRAIGARPACMFRGARLSFNHMVESLDAAFAALANATRRDILARLATGESTVGSIAGDYDMSLNAVSKHLKVLEDAGLVSRTREAQRRPVHLEAEVFDLMTKWIERYRRQAEERYRKLDDVLRAMPDDVDTDQPQTGEQ
jgi:DNA-binding transcriptional ArsR family regulator